jgi:hypothetical protein
MKITKVKYTGTDSYSIARHCAAFLTKTGQVILITSTWDDRDGVEWPFFNTGDAARTAKDIMKAKKESTSFAPIIGAIAWETSEYNDTLITMAKKGELVRESRNERFIEKERNH